MYYVASIRQNVYEWNFVEHRRDVMRCEQLKEAPSVKINEILDEL